MVEARQLASDSSMPRGTCLLKVQQLWDVSWSLSASCRAQGVKAARTLLWTCCAHTREGAHAGLAMTRPESLCVFPWLWAAQSCVLMGQIPNTLCSFSQSGIPRSYW